MLHVDSIFQQIDEGCDVREIRAAIAALLRHHLQILRNSLGYWEKVYFANAITNLLWNISASQQPTTTWLRLCLMNIEKALVSANQRNQDHPLPEQQVKTLTYEQLVENINTALRKMDRSLLDRSGHRHTANPQSAA